MTSLSAVEGHSQAVCVLGESRSLDLFSRNVLFFKRMKKSELLRKNFMGEAGAKAEGEEKNRGEGLLSLRDGWSSHCCKGAPGQSSKPGGRKGTFKNSGRKM